MGGVGRFGSTDGNVKLRSSGNCIRFILFGSTEKVVYELNFTYS